mgnify:CR=1 FL=1
MDEILDTYESKTYLLDFLSSFLLEEGGKGKILSCLAATTPCFDSPYGWRCSPFVIGTSGDMSKAADLEELFNNPEAYNFLPVEANETGKSYGLFIPGTRSLKVPKEETPLGLYLGKDAPSELDLIKIWVADEEKGNPTIVLHAVVCHQLTWSCVQRKGTTTQSGNKSDQSPKKSKENVYRQITYLFNRKKKKSGLNIV